MPPDSTNSPTVISDLASLPERIKTSADRLVDLDTQTRNERAIRDDLIVQAIDHAGMRVRDVAAAARVSIAQVSRVLSTSSAD